MHGVEGVVPRPGLVVEPTPGLLVEPNVLDDPVDDPNVLGLGLVVVNPGVVIPGVVTGLDGVVITPGCGLFGPPITPGLVGAVPSVPGEVVEGAVLLDPGEPGL